MVYLTLVGEQANAGSAAELPPTVSPAAHAEFPAAALVDNRVAKFWSQGSIAADSYIRQDLNRLLNGGLDAFGGGVFTNWANEIAGAGSVTQEMAIKIGGTSSAKLTVAATGGSYTAIRQTITIRAGSKWRGTVGLNPGPAAFLKLEVYDARAGRYLDPSGSWVSAQAYHKIQAATGGFTILPIAFTAQTRKQCGATLTQVRFRVVADTLSSVNYVDEVRAWPEINIAVLAGHNVVPATVVQFRSSTDAFVANDVLVASQTPRPLVQFAYSPTPITSRYVALKFSGTPPEAIRATEAIFGFAEAPRESPSWGFQPARFLRQMRSRDQSFILGPGPEDGVTLHLEPSAADVEEVEDFVLRGLDGSFCFVAITSRDEVFLGRIGPTWTYRAKFFSMTETDIPIEPLPFPLWTS